MPKTSKQASKQASKQVAEQWADAREDHARARAHTRTSWMRPCRGPIGSNIRGSQAYWQRTPPFTGLAAVSA
eukprot:8340370-Lingulodinium_polyedra.AAC.1